jgi:hypothetical protein
METIITNQATSTPSNKVVLTGRIISALCVLFLLFDAIMKIIKENTFDAGGPLPWAGRQSRYRV